VLRGAELDDLQSLFVDEMRVSNLPMGSPTGVNPCESQDLVGLALERQAAKIADRRSSGKRSNIV
jgi:hypothetical protein